MGYRSQSALAAAVSLFFAAGAAQADDVTRPKLLDGVTVEAVESYANPRSHELSVGIGVYPFDSYYYGLSVNAGYTYHFSRNFAWEVLNLQYFFSFQKTLTTQLADNYKVNPTSIPTLNYVLGSNLEYVLAYGKYVLLEDYIRYFRVALLAGAGEIALNPSANSLAGTFGGKFQVFTSETFSWNLEARDSYAFSGGNNYLTFSLGTGFSF